MNLRSVDLMIGVCVALRVVAMPAIGQQPAGDQGITASTVSVYTPPACVPGVPFADVTCSTGFDAWIEQFGLDGITAGCGGGNYCPGSPVTRDQMAVFIEKAMRGTANWPPHTVLVFHHPAAEANSDLNSGTELLAMVAAIPTTGSEAPSATNPWLIKVGPGVYDLGSGSLTLPVYTALEGAGQGVTVITASGYCCGGLGTLVMGDHDKASRLTVNNSGGFHFAVAVYLPASTGGVALDRATLTASTASSAVGTYAMGLWATVNTSFSLVDCELDVQGAYINEGVTTENSTGETRLDGVRIYVHGGSPTGANAGFDGASASPVITNSRINVSDSPYQRGISVSGGGNPLDMRDSEVQVSGPGLDVSAVHLDGLNATLLGDFLTSQGYGLETFGEVSMDVSNCNIIGTTYWLYNQGYTVTVGASKLVGTTRSVGGTVNCFGNYTGSAFLANTCP